MRPLTTTQGKRDAVAMLLAEGIIDEDGNPIEPETLTMANTRAEITGWLDDHGVAYGSKDTKTDLLALVETAAVNA